jgi:1-(5-phosphoribosyl)-5-[(5-phosphoribosylamino)methylideneamino] imidazole-4-carboxamide isomerase/N-(5'phosphoribosyl)anthranilate isomerase
VTNLVLLPAIDVSDGKAVRLVQGELGEKTDYGTPIEVADDFASIYNDFRAECEGKNIEPAEFWVHLVDLDRAFGRGENKRILEEVCEVLNQNNVNVELSGGIRDDDSLCWAIEAGARRVNIGTAALENPEWTAEIIANYGDKVAIGLDVRGTTLSARGWTKDGGELYEVLDQLIVAGALRYVVTDVLRDGTLTGPSIDLLDSISKHLQKSGSSGKLTASGGISSLNDIKTLINVNSRSNGIVDSAIFGKALYAGKFSLLEALHVANHVDGEQGAVIS